MRQTTTTVIRSEAGRRRIATAWLLLVLLGAAGAFGYGFYRHYQETHERAARNEALALIVYSDEVAVIFADEAGTVEAMSPGAERLTPWTAPELVGRNISEAMTGQPGARHTAALEQTDMTPGDVRVIDCDSGPFRRQPITLIIQRHKAGYMVLIYPRENVETTPEFEQSRDLIQRQDTPR